MSTDGTVRYAIEGDARDLVGAAGDARGALGGIGKGAVGAAAVASGALATLAAAATGVGLAVREAAKFETTETGIKTLVKDAQVAKGLMAQVEELSQSTPFQFGDLAGTARLLLGAGSAVGNIKDELTTLGDLAAGAQTDIGGLALILNKVRGAGKLTAETLVQLQERGIGGLNEALSEVTGVPVDKLREAVSKGEVSAGDLEEAFRKLTSQGGLFFQAMANQSQTFEGKVSTLKDKFSALLRTFGQPLLGGAKGGLDAAIAALDSMNQKARLFIATLGQAKEQGKAFEFIGLALRLAFAKSVRFLGTSMLSVGKAAAEGIGELVQAAVSLDGEKLKGLLNGAFTASVFGRISDVLNVDELEAEFRKFTAEGQRALDKEADAMGKAMTDAVKPAADQLGTAVSDAANQVEKSNTSGSSGGYFQAGEDPEKRGRIKGFSRKERGLKAFGGLDEFYGNQVLKEYGIGPGERFNGRNGGLLREGAEFDGVRGSSLSEEDTLARFGLGLDPEGNTVALPAGGGSGTPGGSSAPAAGLGGGGQTLAELRSIKKELNRIRTA